MPHDKEYVIRLNGLDLGQVIDGLEARATAWRLTATYIETGEAPDGFVIQERPDAQKGRGIVGDYQRIIRTAVEQQERQR